MVALDVHQCSIDGPEFEAVLRLLKLAKATVGFLPNAAVRDRAKRGTLLVAKEGSEVVGYLLYDLPRDEIRIVQLVVDPEQRGRGISRVLVDQLVATHGKRRGIFLECRRDFDASKMWPKLGFVPVGERAGRSIEGRPLTAWWRDFGWPTLFTVLAESDPRPVAALDANVVIDLADAASTPALRLRDDWVSGAIRLAVTDETLIEIDRQQDAAFRVPHKQFAAGLDRLTTNEDWLSLEADLVSRLGARASAFRNDIRHVARAANGGARWFVTRDEKFRRACRDVVTTATDLDVVSPAALLVEVDAIARGDLYRPADLEGTDVIVRDVRHGELDVVTRQFVNQSGGERWSTFRDRVNGLLADPMTTRGIVFEVDNALAAFAVIRSGSTVEVPVCRVRAVASGPTIARHLLGWLRSSVEADLGAVWITDDLVSDVIANALDLEGFLPAPGGRTAIVVRGVGTTERLVKRLRRLVEVLPASAVPERVVSVVEDATATPLSAFSLEQVFFPFAVLGAGLATFIVPIRSAWAADLLDPTLSRAQLFQRDRALGLKREHVYYRSPRSSGGLAAPARLLWYVSGLGPGAKTIRATSHLDEIVVGDADRLYDRFAHLGVYSRDHVRESADAGGRVMALRFSHTRLLDTPVTLQRYADLLASDGRGVALAGPQPVSEHVFDSITRLGT
jgi:GNAT superfamily N-acetyltransferase